MNPAVILPIFAAIAGGLLASYVDFHNDEVQAPLLVILITCFVLGATYPRRAWLWALIVAACLTTSHIVAPRFGVQPVDSGSIGNPLSLMFVAIPAALSAYAGAGLRWMFRARVH